MGLKLPFCSKCGKELPEGAVFCTSCGAPVTPAVPLVKPRPKMGKVKAVIKALIGIPCLVVFTYFFLTIFVGLSQILSGSPIAALAGVTVIIISALICLVTLPISYLCLRHIKRDWKGEK